MGRNTWILVLVLVALAIGAGVLFTAQNASRVTRLSFDIGVAAWQLKEPVPIPALIGVCFGAGFVVGGTLVGFRSMRQGARIRRLEQELAVSSAMGGGSDDSGDAAWR